MMDKLVIFDGHCLLSNHFIQFLLRQDKNKVLLFTAKSSQTGQWEILRYKVITPPRPSIVFICKNKVYLQTEAVLHILKAIGGLWPLAYVCCFIPRFARKYLYRLIVRNQATINRSMRSHTTPHDPRILS